MNMSKDERSERTVASRGQNDPTSDGAKYFAYPIVTADAVSEETRRFAGMEHAGTFSAETDFQRLAFKALPIFETGGLWFSAHLDRKHAAFAEAWRIYSDAFPDDERRFYLDQMTVHGHPRYRFSAIMDGDCMVGVLAVWRLPAFWFIEHLAIRSDIRSSGLGGRAVRLLQAHVKGPILLDVEPPTDVQRGRRVSFYDRLGFHFCGEAVTLPPYAGKRTEPSHFMSWPSALNGAARADAVTAITREIYGAGAEAARRVSVAV